jgi:hypothetical protein
MVQLVKREAHNLIEIRYNGESIEKAVYVLGWTKRRKREREREQANYLGSILW